MPTYVSNQHHQKCIQRFPSQSTLDFFEKYIKEEEAFLIAIFVENGHNKQLLNSNKKNNKNNHENNTQNRDYTNLKKLPWILSISSKIKCEFKKIGKDIAFRLAKHLQQIHCQKNKPRLL